MAKKKINIKSVTSDVPSGDVNITYKNVRIAGLSESTTAVLETEDTICEDDIEVEYTKPSLIYHSITVSSIVTNDFGDYFSTDNPIFVVNDNIIQHVQFKNRDGITVQYGLCKLDSGVGIVTEYGLELGLADNEHLYDLSCSDNTAIVSYAKGAHFIKITHANANDFTDFTITVSAHNP